MINLILFILIIGISINYPKITFPEHVHGRIKEVLTNGVIIDHTFYRCDPTQLQINDELVIKAKASTFKVAKNPGGFDERKYLLGKGVKNVGEVEELQVIASHFSFSKLARAYIDTHLEGEMKYFYLYFLLGETSEEIRDFKLLATSLTIIHLFAISGMHFNILHKMNMTLFSYFVDEQKSTYMSLVILTIYLLCLNHNISAFRAYMMLFLGVVSKYNDLQKMGCIGTILLVLNPQIIYNQSFIYSMGIYFLLLICKNLKFSFIYIYIGSALITSYFNYEINLLGLFFTIIFSEVISSTYPIFLLDALSFGKLSPFTSMLFSGLKIIMAGLGKIAKVWITGKPLFIMVILVYLLYILGIYVFIYYKNNLVLLCSMVLLVFTLIQPSIHNYGRVVMLDVGQGDCFLIQSAYQKSNVLIDTGGLQYEDVATKRIIPLLKYYGIDELDAVFVSHDDYDHCGALERLKEYFKVHDIVTDFEEKNYGELIFQQLNHYDALDENDHSQVIYTKLGKDYFLFTGDASENVETYLEKTYTNLEVDVLKVSHHGSDSATSSHFLTHIQPKIALISVGEHNLYHHPSNDVLQRLEAYDVSVYRTDINGCVIICYDNDQLLIKETMID